MTRTKKIKFLVRSYCFYLRVFSIFFLLLVGGVHLNIFHYMEYIAADRLQATFKAILTLDPRNQAGLAIIVLSLALRIFFAAAATEHKWIGRRCVELFCIGTATFLISYPFAVYEPSRETLVNLNNSLTWFTMYGRMYMAAIAFYYILPASKQKKEGEDNS